MAPDFPTDPLPEYPVEETPAEPEVLISAHRDGTEQRRFKGAGRRRKFRIPFGQSMPITYAQRSNILNHHQQALGNTSAFNFTYPERVNGSLTMETIKCRYDAAPVFQHVGFNAYSGEVMLQEVVA